MAEGKKSFVLYADIIYTIEHLTNEEKGILFQHLLDYVNDKNPVIEDRILMIAWKPIERQLKRDLDKYESKKSERSKSGQLGNLKKYHLDLYERVKSDEITLKSALAIAKSRIATHSDANTAVNVNDNVNVNDITTKEAEVDFFKVDEWIKEIGKSQMYLEGLYRTHKLYKGSISELLNNFKEHLKIYPKLQNNFSEFKKHFASWLNIKISKGEMSKYLKNTKGQLWYKN